MLPRMRKPGLLLAMLWMVACGGDGADTPGADGGPGDPDAAPQPPPPGSYVPLIKADWSLVGGQEGYVCATRTLPEDMYVGAIRPIAPLGTHHTVVSINDTPEGADNPGFSCGPEFGRFYASGVGTAELVLPEGVGLIAKKGQQVRINLHLFNASDQTLTGTSGVEVKVLDPSKVEHEARIRFYGPLGFQIPNDPAPFEVSETEAGAAGSTVFAIFPHMHQIGTHFRAEIMRGGSSASMLWDKSYEFEAQEFTAIPQVAAISSKTSF